MELPLSNSEKKLIVDPDIYDILKDRKIHLSTGGYARFYCKSKKRLMYVHKYIMGYPEVQADHINRNKLDCRRENLRLCTAAENNLNKNKQTGEYTSRYKGVSFNRRSNKWQAYIAYQRKQYHIRLDI